MPESNHSDIRNNEAAHRYEWQRGSVLAVLEYQRQGNRITLLHTEVPESLSGQGIGGRLAQAALKDAKTQRLTVVPLCPFVKAYIDRHPEYQELVNA